MTEQSLAGPAVNQPTPVGLRSINLTYPTSNCILLSPGAKEKADLSARQQPFVGVRCYEQTVVMNCRECAAGLAHCHGTLIRHSGHRPECTEDDCESPELICHSLVIDCDTVGCDCAQQTDERMAV